MDRIEVKTEELVRLREALGYQQKDVSERAGIHKSWISQYERGVQRPTLDHLKRLAKALGVHPRRLVTDRARQDLIMGLLEVGEVVGAEVRLIPAMG